jgi:hypothetical protein
MPRKVNDRRLLTCNFKFDFDMYNPKLYMLIDKSNKAIHV